MDQVPEYFLKRLTRGDGMSGVTDSSWSYRPHVEEGAQGASTSEKKQIPPDTKNSKVQEIFLSTVPIQEGTSYFTNSTRVYKNLLMTSKALSVIGILYYVIAIASVIFNEPVNNKPNNYDYRIFLEGTVLLSSGLSMWCGLTSFQEIQLESNSKTA